MTNNSKSIILAACAVLSWSTVATAFKIAGRVMTPFEMVFVASVSALAILCIALTIQKRWNSLCALTHRQWGAMALLGLLNPVVYYLVLFMSYSRLPAQVAQPVNYTWPILLLILLAIFNKQRIPTMKYLGMLLSFAGVACISFGGKGIAGSLSASGMALGLLSALLWASFWLLNKRLCGNIDATLSFFGTFLFGSLYMGVASCFVGLPPMTSEALFSGLYIGAFEMAIPFLCFGVALRITSNPALINQMCYLSPFLSLFFISSILGEPIMITTYIGLTLIVGGIVFNQYFVKDASVRQMGKA